jgi:O-antigen/teichoic acid export membrane protein
MSEVVAETVAPPPEEIGSWRILVRSFTTLLSGEVAARAFGLLGVLLLARRLGPSDFGIVSFALSLVGWFGLVVDSGTELLNVRDIAREPHRFREIAERVLGLRLAISLLASGVFVAVVESFARSTRIRDAVVLFAIVLPALALNLRWMVLGVGAVKAVAAGNVAARAVLALGILVFVHDSPDLHRVPFLQLAAETVYAVVISAAVARHFGLAWPRVDVAAWIETLRQSLPLLVNAFARAAFYSFDVVAIELFLGPRKVGLYTAASKPVLFCTGAIGIFSVSFLSSFSAARGTDAAHWLLRKALRSSFAVCLPVAVALSAGAILIVPLLFGHEYRRAAAVLAVLAWRIPIAALSSPLGSALVAAGRQKTLMRNNVAGAVILVGGDLVAIPLLGIMGAAVVSLAGTVLVLLLNFRAVGWVNPSRADGSSTASGTTQVA